MTVKEATRKLLKDLEAIGWKVVRGRYPRASLGERQLHFRPKSIIAYPSGRILCSAKHYVNCLHRLLLGWEPTV